MEWQNVLPVRSDRQTHLGELRAAIEAHPELACGVVERRGVSWISVVRVGAPQRLVEVGCDFLRAEWWFTWSDGRTIGSVRDVDGVVAVLVRELA
ncbi:hypothetical protein ACFOY4_30105 [Actinomadura syzygii]|uniref:Uncharacterized protein n=1 Tax=Actinomadura syzygii TaxID=1427538 RepID=A0A5D0TVU4_9ACTN|nr:hypothetical protein [Actinomadura syzygii]TYC09432.1 hypothetical protein FXF65_34850 [Actinomadura syzygii]